MQWEMVELGNVVKIIGGGTPSKTNPNYWNGNIPWATVKDLNNFEINDTIDYISEEGLKNSASNLIPSGTVITATRVGLGKVSINKLDLAINQDLKALFPIEKLDKKYLFYFLLSKASFFEAQGKGATVKGITLDILKQIQIPLPPLAEQQRLAALLDTADALRRHDRQLLAHYDRLVQAVFLDLFGDPIRNEKGWEVKKLGEIGTLDRGISKHRPRNAPELIGGPYPLIQTGDVANSNGLIRSYNSTYSEVGLKQSKLWKKGTLCITIAANIAKTGILTFDACFPDSVVGFQPKEDTKIEFVQLWFSFMQKILEDGAPESAQKNINLAILRNLEIISPPLSLQTHFAALVHNIEAQKERVRAQAAQSEALFQGLLQQAFQRTGEL